MRLLSWSSLFFALQVLTVVVGAQQGKCPRGGCPSSGRVCPPRYNQCPALGNDGTSVGPKTNAATCDPGSAGCQQGMQCQSRARNPFMPAFHILGNFTDGDGSQPVSVNDVSSIIQRMGVWHGARLLSVDCVC